MNYNENVSIWLIGNTGLRNPMRIQDGFRAFAESPFVGNLHGKEEIPFEKYLNEKGIIHTGEGTKTDGTYARKWRLMFARYDGIKDYTFIIKDLYHYLGGLNKSTGIRLH